MVRLLGCGGGGSGGGGGGGSITGGGNVERGSGAGVASEMEVKSPCWKYLREEVSGTNGWNKWTCIAVDITERDV